MYENLSEAYLSIYSEAKTLDPARAAAAARIDALKKNPKENAYVKTKTSVPTFGKSADAWSQDTRADADYAKVNKKSPTHIKFEEVELLRAYLVSEGYVTCVEDAEVLREHMSDEWKEFALNEMRKEDKVAGKKSGGVADPAYREVKKMIRGMEGTPAGQQKKVPGKKPPAAGERGGPMSPRTKVNINRARRQEGERNQSSAYD